MNLISAHHLDSLIQPASPHDEQSACIEALFTEENFEALGIEDDGSNENNTAFMRAYLRVAECPSRVEAMIEDWLENGF